MGSTLIVQGRSIVRRAIEPAGPVHRQYPLGSCLERRVVHCHAVRGCTAAVCESEKSARPTLQRVHAQTPSISRGGPERRRRWPPVVSVEPHRSCGLGQYPIFIDMYTSSDLPTSNRAHLARKAPDSADNHPKTPCLPSRTARQGSTAVSGARHRPGQSVWGRRGRVGGGPSPLQLESTGWRLHHPAAAGDGGV